MKQKDQSIISITGRLTLFLYILSVSVLFLYILGNFQEFTDSSLIMLLKLYRYSALVFIAFAVSYIITMIIGGRNTGRKVVLRIIFTFLGLVLSVIFFLVIEIIITGLEPVL